MTAAPVGPALPVNGPYPGSPYVEAAILPDDVAALLDRAARMTIADLVRLEATAGAGIREYGAKRNHAAWLAVNTLTHDDRYWEYARIDHLVADTVARIGYVPEAVRRAAWAMWARAEIDPESFEILYRPWREAMEQQP